MQEIKIENNVIKFGAFNYYLLQNSSSIKPEELQIYDAIIIEGGDLDFVKLAVKKIRSHFNPELYLKPVFLLHAMIEKDVLTHNLIDGMLFSLEQINLIEDTVKQIYLMSNELYFPKSISFEAQIINKTINLLYTRNKNRLNAYPYFHSGIGYTLPEISINFKPDNESEIFRILNIAVSEGLFKAEFEQRVYLCTNCEGGYLNYREVCPQCSSSDSEAEDLVHHFPCAYVGPIADFKNTIDDALNCPKCNKSLRHIGVDYDKPSVLHTCRKCNHQYQDYNVKAKCLLCSFDNEVDKLIPKAVNHYSLTKKGESIAINGYISTSTDFDEIPGTVTYDTFKVMLKYEIERLRQNDYTSNIAYLHIVDAGEIYSRIGTDRQKSLVIDLIEILRNDLRSSDFISFYNASTLILSLNEIPNKIANKILVYIKRVIEALLQKNFKDMKIELMTNAIPLTTSLSHDLQLQKLIQELDHKINEEIG